MIKLSKKTKKNEKKTIAFTVSRKHLKEWERVRQLTDLNKVEFFSLAMNNLTETLLNQIENNKGY